MTINDMIDAGICIEGEVEVRKWVDMNDNNPAILFKNDAYELDMNASYMDEEVSYMFAYNDIYETVLCFELAW